jgi:hypothetical protein
MRVERERESAEGSHAHLARTSSATPPVADEGMQSATHATVDTRITADIRHVTLPISCPAMARDAHQKHRTRRFGRGGQPHTASVTRLPWRQNEVAKMAVEATPFPFF